jgi:hypothetical protein
MDKVYGSNAKNYSNLVTHTHTHTQNQCKCTWFHLTASQWFKKTVFANNAIYTEIFGPRSDFKLSTIQHVI